MNIHQNKYFKFAIAAILYVLWVIWVGSYWLLPGLLVVFDIYVTKKVNWAFWKKREGKNSTLVEWIDALIFAVIAVTFINIFFFQNFRIPTGSMEKTLLIGDHLFVSKVSYGPRIPNTPLTFPFTQHTIPLIKTKSYLEWIKWPYKRLKGLTEIKNNDIVVFNFPTGDTVVVERQAQDYYSIIREHANNLKSTDSRFNREVKSDETYYLLGRQQVLDTYKTTIRPVDKKDNYIKRCVGIPGDTIQIKDAVLYVNGNPKQPFEGQQSNYLIFTDGSRLNPKTLERLGIYKSDVFTYGVNEYVMTLTSEMVDKMQGFKMVSKIDPIKKEAGEPVDYIFPHDARYSWNEDHFGPLWIPKAGTTITLDTINLPLYRHLIVAYEKNDLSVRDGKIFVNGKETGTYTFQMDYYWMMGDNRHDSADSRFWGFVPEDHIVGKPKYIWLSIDKEKKFLAKIRFRRMFKKIQ